MKRHLTSHGLTPQQYRAKWGPARRLPDDGAQLFGRALGHGQGHRPRAEADGAQAARPQGVVAEIGWPGRPGQQSRWRPRAEMGHVARHDPVECSLIRPRFRAETRSLHGQARTRQRILHHARRQRADEQPAERLRGGACRALCARSRAGVSLKSLIGGLGMGFTLARRSECWPLVQLSSPRSCRAVIAWARGPMAELSPVASTIRASRSPRQTSAT